MLAIALFAAALLQPPPVDEIHVDERCRIYSQDRANPSGTFNKPSFRADTAICFLKGDKKSEHWEQTLYDGVVKRTKVHIHERNYVLHNPTNQTIAFILDSSLPDGWVIDSVPQPQSVEDHMATFRVYARPQETITLHIGSRH
jgi:hypothetical protein